MAHKAEEKEHDTIRVTVAALGDVEKSVILPAGATVSTMLEAADYPASARVRIRGEVYENGDELDDGDVALVVSGDKPSGA